MKYKRVGGWVKGEEVKGKGRECCFTTLGKTLYKQRNLYDIIPPKMHIPSHRITSALNHNHIHPSSHTHTLHTS